MSLFLRTSLAAGCAMGITLMWSAQAHADSPPPLPPPAADTVVDDEPAPPSYPTPAGTAAHGGADAPPPPPNRPAELEEYDSTAPVPAGYTRVKRMRKGLVIGGAITFGVTYLTSAFAASVDADTGGSNPLTPLWVPAVGPFIAMANGDIGASGKFVLLVDGVAQSAGLAMLIVGLAVPSTKIVRNDLLFGGKVQLTPTAGRQGSGLMLSGSF